MGISGYNIEDQFAALAEILSGQGIEVEEVKAKLKAQEIETPSWGYGNSGTRFGVFKQPGAARDVHERLSDAAQVHKVTGVCPGVALHIPWDKVDDYDALQQEATELGCMYRSNQSQCLPRSLSINWAVSVIGTRPCVAKHSITCTSAWISCRR